MALANLYGFGRLAWNPNLTTDQILELDAAYLRQRPARRRHHQRLQRTHGISTRVHRALGLGTLTDIIGIHFGPGIESAERNGWGQWFRADAKASGWTAPSPPAPATSASTHRLAKVYESLNSCPDDLLLFMHHVPYTHVLHDGKTVIQYVYDAHYEGAATAQTYAPRWQTLHGLVDDDRYNETLKLLNYQAGHAIVWRDAVTRWFQKKSSIPDKLGRVGNYPNRIEAEDMTPMVTPPLTSNPGRPPPTAKPPSATNPPAAPSPPRSTNPPAPTTSPSSTSTTGPANPTSPSTSTENPSAHGSPTTPSHPHAPKTNPTATPAPASPSPTSP